MLTWWYLYLTYALPPPLLPVMSLTGVVGLLPEQRSLLPDGVVPAAAGALDAQHVEATAGGAEAVAAVGERVQVLEQGHDLIPTCGKPKCVILLHLVALRQRRLADLLVVDGPHLPHVDQAAGADGAAEVAGADQLVETGLVDLEHSKVSQDGQLGGSACLQSGPSLVC